MPKSRNKKATFDTYPEIDLAKIKKYLKLQQIKVHAVNSNSNTKKEDEIIDSMYQLLSEAIDSNGSDKDLGKIEKMAEKLTSRCEKLAKMDPPKSTLSAEKKVDRAIKETDKILKLWTVVQDFLKIAQPINQWETNVYTEAIPFYYDSTQQGYFTRDKTTGALYCDDDASVLRLKLFLLSLGTCTVNLIGLLANSVSRLAKIITFYELRNPENPTITNLKNYGSEIARLVFGPVLLIGMQITAILGAITPMKNGPRDARKMYALGESLIFGFSRDAWRLAPCFRPDPKYHLFGGKIGAKNQW